jgi:hypothetical protein
MVITSVVALLTLTLWYLLYLKFPGTLNAEDTTILAAFSFGLVFAVRFLYQRLRRKETS